MQLHKWSINCVEDLSIKLENTTACPTLIECIYNRTATKPFLVQKPNALPFHVFVVVHLGCAYILDRVAAISIVTYCCAIITVGGLLFAFVCVLTLVSLAFMCCLWVSWSLCCFCSWCFLLIIFVCVFCTGSPSGNLAGSWVCPFFSGFVSFFFAVRHGWFVFCCCHCWLRF